MSLQGRVALVTGGSRGVGRAICLALAEAGADPAVNYRRDADAAAEVVAAATAMGRRAHAYPATVGIAAETEALVAAVLTDLGHLDILVSNAGIASRGRSVADTDPDEVERLLRTHAVGAHHLCRPEDVAAVVRFLVSDDGGYVTGQRIAVDGGGAWGEGVS